jgi:mutator protein MutT
LEAEIRVLAAVIGSQSRLLLAKRPGHKRHGGLWEFPGGKVRDGESDLEAITRELREELGLEVLGAKSPLWEALDPDSPFRLVFLPVIVEGDPRPTEHDAVLWGSPVELAKLPLAPTDRTFLERFFLNGDK